MSDNPFVTPVSGQADWDSSLNADFGVLERGYHVTERAGVAINSGQVLWLNSGGFFFPFDPNSKTIYPTAMAYTAAASGDSLTALAWGIVRSLGINSPAIPGFALYTSALTPGVIVTTPNGPKIGRGLAGYGVLFNPHKSQRLAELTDVNTNGLSNGKVLAWADASSKWVPTTAGAGGSTTLAGLTDVDTTGVSNLKVLAWSNASSKWVPTSASAGGGGTQFDPGTPPTVVQFAFNTNGTNGVTFSDTPSSGNLLVAIVFSPDSDTAGTGWTKQNGENSSGTDFGYLVMKALSAPGTQTQTPTSGISATGCMAVWELTGQNASPFVTGVSQTEQSGTANLPILLPCVKDCLGLSAVGVGAGAMTVLNGGSLDVNNAGGTRALAAGHTNLSVTPMVGLMTAFGGTLSSKGFSALFKS